MQKGKFIMLEGMEFSGKTVCTGLLKEVLAERNINAVFTREPGGTPTGSKIRDILLNSSDLTSDERALLFLTSRAIHCREVIEPSLNEGTWVVSDRYSPSNLVMQHESKELIEHISNKLKFTQPDYMVYAKCGEATTLERMQGRTDNNVLDYEFTNKYQHYSDLYDQYVATAPHPTLRLDTNKVISDLKSELADFVDKILGEQYV